MDISAQQLESFGQIAGVLSSFDASMIRNNDQFQSYVVICCSSPNTGQNDMIQPIQFYTSPSLPSVSPASISSMSILSVPQPSTEETNIKFDPGNIELECHESMCSSSNGDPCEDVFCSGDVNNSIESNESYQLHNDSSFENATEAVVKSENHLNEMIPLTARASSNSYPRRRHICKMCPKSYAYIRNLRKHEEQNHLPLNSYEQRPPKEIRCKLCRTNFRENEFSSHVAEAHQNLWECSVCHRTFGSLRGLKLHVFFHSEPREKKYECNICFRKYTHSRSLTFHKKSHDEDEKKRVEEQQKQLLQQQMQQEFILPTFSFVTVDHMNENP